MGDDNRINDCGEFSIACIAYAAEKGFSVIVLATTECGYEQ
jgi:hypothetical protein